MSGKKARTTDGELNLDLIHLTDRSVLEELEVPPVRTRRVVVRELTPSECAGSSSWDGPQPDLRASTATNART